MEKEYYSLPQPEEVTTREKEDAMGAYLMMFASIGAGLPLPIVNLIAAVIYYYLNRSKSIFVKFHSLQALLIQIPVTILNSIGVFWAIRIFFSQTLYFDKIYLSYLVFLVLVNLANFIFGIIAAVKARKGRMYYFIFFGGYCYRKVFAMDVSSALKAEVNLPPRL